MFYIYVLELEQNKYYVGKTNNINFRIQDHINSNGSSWTKKYKPIRILEIISNADDYDEDKYTRIYMDKFGIDNVRGGSYVTINLDYNTVNQLKKMSISTNNKCFNCGKSGHFVKSCPDKKITITCERCGRNHPTTSCYAKKDINGIEIHEYSEDSNSHEEFNNIECTRCRRIGHDRSNCYEIYDRYGNPIQSCIIS